MFCLDSKDLMKLLKHIAILLMFTAPLRAATVADVTYTNSGNNFNSFFSLAQNPEFGAVGLLTMVFGQNTFTGTATWIGGNYILTAGHNVTSGSFTGGDFDASLAASNVTFTLDQGIGGGSFTGNNIIRNPFWNGDSENYGYDMAIIELSSFSAPTGVNPFKLYGGDAELGQSLLFMGYGNRGLGSTGENPPVYGAGNEDVPPRKMGAMNVIDQIGQNQLLIDFDNGNSDKNTLLTPATLGTPTGGAPSFSYAAHQPSSEQMFTLSGTVYEGLLGSGDSGGPAFIRINDEWLIAGINAWGDGTAAYGDVSGFSRVSGQQSFILGAYPDAVFVIPEPSTYALIGLGLLLITLAGRRSAAQAKRN
jgi:hypothetical protein